MHPEFTGPHRFLSICTEMRLILRRKANRIVDQDPLVFNIWIYTQGAVTEHNKDPGGKTLK